MGDTVGGDDASYLVGILENLLDELDARCLIQTAAKVASTIDTLKAEIERTDKNVSGQTQQVNLARAIERD